MLACNKLVNIFVSFYFHDSYFGFVVQVPFFRNTKLIISSHTSKSIFLKSGHSLSLTLRRTPWLSQYAMISNTCSLLSILNSSDFVFNTIYNVDVFCECLGCEWQLFSTAEPELRARERPTGRSRARR